MPASGLINLYKPAGFSSARWAYKLRPILGERRIGHAGSLDPFADGVLLVCAGRATRLVERLMALPKTYETTLILGVTSPTFDPETPAWPVDDARPPGLEAIRAAAAAFTGEIEQTPPTHSAVKVAGWSSYQLARAGCAVVLSPRRVRVDSIEMLDYAYPVLRLRIRCGRGTYIRALARDLGSYWGCGAICRTLTRLAVGPYRAADAVELRGARDPDVLRALQPVDQVQGCLNACDPAGPAPIRRAAGDTP